MYLPLEDSYFLSSELEKFLKNKNKKLNILDIGAGSGIQAKTCLKLGFNKVICADIDNEALSYLKKQKLKAIKSDLFSKIKRKFSLIIFNPPYLPEHKYDKAKDTSGGIKGDETILDFLNQAKSHMNKDSKILLLLSSLTPRKRINNLIKNLNYKKTKLAEKKLFFEKLEIWLISN